MSHRWYVLNINAEPWAIGSLDIGRRNGKIFPRIGPNLQLKSFQEAVKEELEGVEMMPPGEYVLEFFIWRSIDSYDGAGKRVKKNQVDATNIQKGLEDALQGVLFNNDRAVRDVSTVIVEQAENVEPRIVIHCRPWEGFSSKDIPDHVWVKIDEASPRPSQTELDYKNADPLF